MKPATPVRLWLLLALLVSATLGLQQLGRHGMMGAGLYNGQSLEDGVEVLHDASGRLDLAAVEREYAAGHFARPARQDLTFGYTGDALWLTTVVGNASPDVIERYLEVGPPRLEDVRLYLPHAGGGFREIRSGLRVPMVARVVPSRQLVVPLALPGGAQQRLYVRVASRNSIAVELRLWQPTRFLEAARHMDLLNGLQFGALLLFALYAFAAAGAMGERAYVYFGITLLSYAAYDISILQYGYQYLWPDSPDWSLRSPGCVLSASIFGLGMVVASLLETEARFPRWNRALRALSLAGLLLIAPMLLGDYRFWVQWLNYVGLAQLLVTIGVALQAVFMGTRGAAVLLGAFLLLWFTSLLRVSQILGWLPNNILSEYSQGWSMVVGGLLMAMTQANRVRRLDAEREDARRDLVQAQVRAREEAERAVALRTRELVQARDAAEASSRAKSAFLAQLSHELRTPLHSILGYGALLRAEATDAESQRRLDAIRRSGQHLLQLIDGLLDYARGEAGRLQVELQPLRLRTFLDSVVEETRGLAGQQGMVLETAYEPGLPESLRLDGTRLRQVLLNLLANACRHSQGRHIRLSARPEAAARSGQVRFSIAVSDDGIGIPPADRERIFQAFEQVTEGAASKGLGLGLAIARQLVGLMGGSIVLEPTTTGACFRITLEAELIDLPAPERVAEAPAPRRYAGPRRQVLVVDDHLDSRELLATMLRGMGFGVVAAADGREALERLQHVPVDLVLTDQRMPGMDGRALLAAARARGLQQPFILATAGDDTGTAMPAGFAATLSKPLDTAALEAALGRALGLAWQQPSAAPGVATGSREEGAAWARPSAALLEELRAAAEQGRISDIEDWVEHVRLAEPSCAGFAQDVLVAVRRLDLAGIVAMTR